jgi:hypothetical protein
MWPRTRRRRSESKWEVLLHLPGGCYGTQAWRPSCLSTFTLATGAYMIVSKRAKIERKNKILDFKNSNMLRMGIKK